MSDKNHDKETVEEETEETIEEVMSVAEQIERSSVNVNVFSSLDQESMIPVNIPIMLGGDDIISEKTTIEKIEEGFGQLNIMDLFSEREFILNCAQYSTYQFNNPEVLSPNIYELKARSSETYLLNMLITPYSDLNLTKYFDEIQFMTDAFGGVVLRQKAEQKSLSEASAFEEGQQKSSRLASYLQFLIFKERSMRSGVERVKKESFMLCAMFINARVEVGSELQCFGECGLTFKKDEISGNYCECGGELLEAPPILKIEEISYAYPAELGRITNNQVTPITALDNYLSIIMPRTINLAINRIAPEIFATLVTIPRKSIYYSKDFQEYIEILSDWRENEDKTIRIFAAVTDTRFTEEQLPSSITMSVLVRDYVEGLKKGLPREEIHQKTQISDWKLSPYLKLVDIDQYQTFEEIPDA